MAAVSIESAAGRSTRVAVTGTHAGSALAFPTTHARSPSAPLAEDDTGTQRFTYDANGDRTGVTSPGGTVTLGYDQADRLTSISGGTSYRYDGDGLRTSKTVGSETTGFVWDQSGDLPLLLQAGSTSYIYGPHGQPIEQITDGTATYLLADQQDSTRLLLDASGEIVGRYGYDPWGNVTGHDGGASTNLQYDGQYADAESGLTYLRARYYDPTTGQFLTRDPLVATTRSPYGYAGDDPVNVGDPTGELGVGGWLLIGGGVVATVGICNWAVNRTLDWLFPADDKLIIYRNGVGHTQKEWDEIDKRPKYDVPAILQPDGAN
jgi:RHS repeat-associated protein